MKIQTQAIPSWMFKFTFLFFLFAQTFVYSQFTIPPKPSFQTSVYDNANLLSTTEKAALEQKLINYSDSTSTQIVVVTTPTINGEDIGILSVNWAQKWGVGQAKEDNGIFILLAAKEREIWIAPGYGVEDRLVAGINGEIIRNIIIPEFKAGSYYNGLDKGADAIFEVLNGKYKGSRQEAPQSVLPLLLFILFFILIIFLISKGKNNGNNSGRGGGGPSLLDVIILSNMGRSGGGSFGGGGFGGSSGGGGGFGGGFGGGGFSGGGAGGSW